MTIEGRTYELSHLDPFTFEFVVSEKEGRPPQVYAIDVLFSWHCFTRGIAAGETFTGALAYRHGRETRLFDSAAIVSQNDCQASSGTSVRENASTLARAISSRWSLSTRMEAGLNMRFFSRYRGAGNQVG